VRDWGATGSIIIRVAIGGSNRSGLNEPEMAVLAHDAGELRGFAPRGDHVGHIARERGKAVRAETALAVFPHIGADLRDLPVLAGLHDLQSGLQLDEIRSADQPGGIVASIDEKAAIVIADTERCFADKPGCNVRPDARSVLRRCADRMLDGHVQVIRLSNTVAY
jgi:hypothetical protein